MNHEQMPTAEQERRYELPVDVFNLEKLSPQQVAGLVESICEMNDEEQKTATPLRAISDLDMIICADLERLTERSPDKALEVYSALTVTDNQWTKATGMLHIAEALVRHYDADSENRNLVIDSCIHMLEDREELVRNVADEILYGLIEEELLDDATATAVVGRMEEAQMRVRARAATGRAN
ncbi:hypothetical protein AB0M48_35090 [Lentzea sp. NPDC051208]|uniref:hypothetical protein n=1 Tax=Lentzea sp. NPDC051208 TaxID=3154642 RepID=UPI003427B3D6